MPRIASTGSIDEIVRSAIAPIVARASEAVARSIAEMVAAELESQLKTVPLKKPAPGPARRRGRPAAPRQPRSEITKWVADRRARRVPTFVIEATGLDTKKKIVAKFGENAAFEKGKPVPVTRSAAALAVAAPKHAAARVVRAKPPTIRKAAGAR